MVTIREIIERVDELRPNAFSEKLKLMWIGELDGKIGADVMLLGIEDIRQREYKHPEDMDSEPLVTYPHDGIYLYWLQAQIDYANGEYNKYQNSMEMYNANLNNFVRWFANTYEPARGYPARPWQAGWEDPPYYLTAYGLAVKCGYQGSLEEWLASLQGPRGADGTDGKDGADGRAGRDGKDGDPGVYVLAEGETVADAPADAEVVIDPNGEAEAPGQAPAVSMKPLTFTGAVNATYDGSEAVSVEIPQGGGGAGEWKHFETIELTEHTYSVLLDLSSIDNVQEVFVLCKTKQNRTDTDVTSFQGASIKVNNASLTGSISTFSAHPSFWKYPYASIYINKLADYANCFVMIESTDSSVAKSVYGPSYEVKIDKIKTITIAAKYVYQDGALLQGFCEGSTFACYYR